MRIILLSLLFAAPLWACCPIDKDPFAAEARAEVLDLIAGRIERESPAHWLARLEAAKASDATKFDRHLAMALALDQLNRQNEAFDLIEPLQGDPLAPSQHRELAAVRLQVAVHAWWRGGVEGYDANICLLVAREAVGLLGMEAALLSPSQQVLTHVVKWMTDTEPADATVFLRDFFNLRLAGNKTSDHDTGELKRLNLLQAEQGLLDLLRLHPVWENIDTFHALNMLYAVEGRQSMAYYARLRVHDLLRDGRRSRVPEADKISDIKPMLAMRQLRGNVLVPVNQVSDVNRTTAEAQFAARRENARKWLAARDEYARGRNYSADFWSGFRAPAFEPPALTSEAPADSPAAEHPAVSEAEASEDGSFTVALLSIGALLVLLAAGMFLKSRIPEARPEAEDAA